MKTRKDSKKVSWRVNVPQRLQERFQLIASVGEVRVDDLVSHILEGWIKSNKQLLMDDALPARLKGYLSADPVSKKPG